MGSIVLCTSMDGNRWPRGNCGVTLTYEGTGSGEPGSTPVGILKGRRYRGGALAATATQRLVFSGKGGLT